MKKVTIISSILITLIFVSGTNLFASDTPKGKAKAFTTTATGIITDEKTGESLAGVVVKLEGTDQEIYTDFDGVFSFKGLAPGNYTISTSMISYKKGSSKISVKLNSDNLVKIKLKSVGNK